MASEIIIIKGGSKEAAPRGNQFSLLVSKKKIFSQKMYKIQRLEWLELKVYCDFFYKT